MTTSPYNDSASHGRYRELSIACDALTSDNHSLHRRERVVESDGSDGGRTSKRARVNAACEACKSRKLGCSGFEPCTRCIQDRKPCTFLRRERRSPLTRERMTQLEERVYHYETVWDAIFPSYPIVAVLNDALHLGMSVAVDRARISLRSDVHGDHSARELEVEIERGAGAEQHVSSDRDMFPPPIVPTPAHNHSRDRDWIASTPIRSTPPTRAPSPETSSTTDLLGPNYNETGGTYEWAEGDPPRREIDGDQNRTEATDAGMASLAPSGSGKGSSYFGLSSGATFLNAIRRLSPQAVSGLSPNGAFIASESLASGAAAWAGAAVGNDWHTKSRSRSRSSTAPNGTYDTAQSVGVQVKLPPLAETMPMLESYFQYFHPLTPIVHEPTIRAQVLGAIPLAKPGSDVLIYMIFAMGALDLSKAEDEDDGNRYYEVARQALQRSMLEGGTLPLVQGLAIMANYLQRSNRPNAGYLCLGWAIRMATALGLHTNPVGNRCSVLEKEMRKRVWWSVVTLEAGCAVTFGRPSAHGLWQLSAVPLPINCNDEHLTVSTTSLPIDSESSTLYTALIVQARLAKVTCGIHETILQSNPIPSIDQIRRYDKRVANVFESLPAYMKGWTADEGPYELSRAVQVWRARDFRAILHRPLLLAAAWDASKRKAALPGVREAIEACRALAFDNLDDIGKFVNTPAHRGRGAEWYSLYFAFQASLTLLLSIIWEPNHPSAMNWKGMLISTAAWFRNIQSMRTLALAYAKILESVVGIEAPQALGILEQFAQLLGASSVTAAANSIGTNTSIDSETFPKNIVGAGAGAGVNTSMNGTGIGSRTGSGVEEDLAPQGDLDFERYWMEIWGNDSTSFDFSLPSSGSNTMIGFGNGTQPLNDNGSGDFVENSNGNGDGNINMNLNNGWLL